jgi:hypothetical protein
MAVQEQLSLEIGGEVGAFVVAEFSFSGKVTSLTQILERDETVHLRVCDEDGQILMHADGWVQAVQIKTAKATESQPRHTVRKHSIKLGEVAPE